MGNKQPFIRPYREGDLEQVLKIWLNQSLKAHAFIPGQYWEGHQYTVRDKYLPNSDTFVAEKEGEILGFISLIGNYVGAIFVSEAYQKQGIGKSLMEYAYRLRKSLFVDVYKENQFAVKFYIDFGFMKKREKVQPETGHVTITMYIGEQT